MIIRTASPPGFFYCFFQLSHFSHPFPFLPSIPISPIHSHNSHHIPFLPSHRHVDMPIYRTITPFLNKKNAS